MGCHGDFAWHYHCVPSTPPTASRSDTWEGFRHSLTLTLVCALLEGQELWKQVKSTEHQSSWIANTDSLGLFQGWQYQRLPSSTRGFDGAGERLIDYSHLDDIT